MKLVCRGIAPRQGRKQVEIVSQNLIVNNTMLEAGNISSDDEEKIVCHSSPCDAFFYKQSYSRVVYNFERPCGKLASKYIYIHMNL